jgi:hypothetical protein
VTPRRVSTLVLAGASALAVALPAGISAAPAGNQVPLVVPPTGSVALEAVKLHITGPGAGKAAAPDQLELRGAVLPAETTAMVAGRTWRSAASVTVTLLAVTVSRTTRTSTAPLPSITLSDVGSDSLVLAAGMPRKTDTVWQTTKSSAPAVGCQGCKVQVSAVGLVDTGATPPTRGAALSRALATVLNSPVAWNPVAKPQLLTGRGVTIRRYDAAHPTGRPLAPQLASQALIAAAELLQGPAISVRDAVYEVIDETSACILEQQRCGDFVFSFKGLKETTIRTDEPSYHKTTSYSGRSCGRTLLGQPWKITTKSDNAAPVTRTINLAKTKVVFVDTATVNGATGTAIHKLLPQVGALPGMQVVVDATGVWSSNLGGGVTVPVSVTKLPPGKHC